MAGDRRRPARPPQPGRRLLLLVGALTALVFTSGVLLAIRSERSERDSVTGLAEVTARDAALRVDQAIRVRIEFVEGAARLPQVVEGDPVAIRAALASLARGGPVDAIAWVRPDGTIAADAADPASPVIDAAPAHRAAAMRALRAGAPVVSDAVPGPATSGGGYALVAAPTTDAAGRPSGALTGLLPLDALTEPLQVVGDDLDLALLDRADRVISAPLAADAPVPVARPEAAARVRGGGAGSIAGTPGVRGEPDRLVAFAPVASAGWVAVYQQPRSTAFGAARREFGGRVAVWTVLAVGGMLLAWFVGRRLDASARAERLARGRVDLLRRTGAALAAAVTVEDVTAAAISDPELGAAAVAVYLRGDAPPVAVAGSHPGVPTAGLLATPPLPGGPVAHVARSGAAVFMEEAPPDAAVSAAGLTGGGRRPSVAALPLRTPEEHPGVMLLAFTRPRAFTADDRELLLALADQTAQALERALRHEAERVRRRRAEILEHLTTALEREMTVRGRARVATRLLVPDLADYATIETQAEDAHGGVVLGLTHRDPAMEPVLRSLREEHRLDRDEEHSVLRTLETGRPMLIERVPPELIERYSAREGVGDKLRRLGPRSHLVLPLRARGHMVAALMLGRSDPLRPPFRAEDVAFAAEIASRLGVAIENAALYEQQREIALGLQLSLLPEAVPRLREARLAVRYQPGQHHMEVGGDWYDAFRLPDGRLALAVGDVVGRGLSAAAVMGRLRTALAALAPGADGPAETLRLLDAFAANVPGSDLTTLTYVVVCPATGHLVYASAGHPPPLVLYPDGRTRWLSGGRSVPLRSIPGCARTQAGAELPVGAKLLLYSDGLVERRGEGIDDGLARLAAAAREHRALHPERLVDALVAELADGADLADDVVVVCMEHSGRTAPPPAERHGMLTA